MQLQAAFKDARYFQIIFQFIFLGYGILFLHWDGETWLYVTYLIACLLTQLVCETIFGKPGIPLWVRYKKGIPSAIISALSLSLLLKTNFGWVAIMAAAISILSKYIIRFNRKHIFNPSALGIVCTILFTGKAWFSPGQWGSGMVILFGVCSLGYIITTRIQKPDVSIAFLGTFAALLFARQIIYLGWPMDYFIQSVSTGSLLLFSFFMITDPKTIPDHKLARIFWSMAVAVVSFYFTAFRFVNGAPLFVLLVAQLLVPVLDKFFKAKRFEWAPENKYTREEERFMQIIYSRSSM